MTEARRQSGSSEHSKTSPRLEVARRLGVVACIAAAVATAALKLEDVLGVFDGRADANSAQTYSQRTHTHPEWSPAAGRVLENARLWMPEDATYRVVFGPAFDRHRSSDFTYLLLVGFLLPRRPSTSDSAPWVFCYGCDEHTLGDRFKILSRTAGGPWFGRIVP